MIKLRNAFVSTINIDYVAKYEPYDSPTGLNSNYEIYVHFHDQNTLILKYVTAADMNADFFKFKDIV